jgi:hypothetical protein
MTDASHLRFHDAHQENAAHPFGGGAHGKFAEKVARSMGTPQFLIGQKLLALLDQNTEVTTEVHTLAEQMTRLTEEVHRHVCTPESAA